MLNWKEYEKINDVEADETIAKAAEISAAIILAVCLMNSLGLVFKLDKYFTFLGTFTTMIFLCIPCVLVMKLKNKQTTLRYGITICITLAVIALYSFFSYHVAITFVLPIMIASFYADIALYIFAAIITYIGIVAGSIANAIVCADEAIASQNIPEMLYGSALPMCLIFTVIVIVEYMSIKRANAQLNQLYYNAINIEASHNEMRRTQEELVYAIADISESSSQQTGAHIRRVAKCAKIFGKYICKDENEIEYLSIASMLHDVGKLMIPNELIEKQTRLTDEEYEIVKRHTDEGRKLLQNAPGRIMEMARNIAYYHHERWDGKGYHNIKGEDIEYYSRYIAVLDVFDALISPRSYKEGWSPEKVYEEIVSQSGKQFAPEAVRLFIKCYPEIKEVYGIKD